MWKSITGAVGGGWNWFLGSPIAQFFAAGLGLLLAWSVTVNRLKAEGAREQKRIHDAADARERAEMVEARAEVSSELQERIARADEAVARHPQFQSTGELRKLNPRLAALILGPDTGDGQ